MEADPQKLKLVHDAEAADFDCIRVTLFRRDDHGGVSGWYIGPADRIADGQAYLPASTNTLASVAVIRALALAEALGTRVCVIDPDDLWSTVWGF